MPAVFRAALTTHRLGDDDIALAQALADEAVAPFRSYARAPHLRLAARIMSGDFDTTAIPAPPAVRPEDRSG